MFKDCKQLTAPDLPHYLRTQSEVEPKGNRLRIQGLGDKEKQVTTQGTYYSPTFNYKVKSHEDYWAERKKMTHTVGDNFFKKSQRYKLNPDFSPKHVGMPWSIVDASDFVKPSAIIMA